MAHRLGLVPIYADPRAFVFVVIIIIIIIITTATTTIIIIIIILIALIITPSASLTPHRHSSFMQCNIMLRFVADESRDISELQEDDTLVFKLSAW